VGLLIPIIAIAGGLAIPITAIIVDYKRRKLVAQERMAMIEKGMVPPPLDEKSVMAGAFDDKSRGGAPERALKGGLALLGLGMGLAVAVFILRTQMPDLGAHGIMAVTGGTFGLTIGATVLSFLGLGNLAYYFIARNKYQAPPAS
jgi:hypothetical protein